MEKKFKCQQCGHEFMADTNKYVTCPNCDSDNVALAKSSSPVLKIVLIVVAALVAVGAIVWALLTFTGGNDNETEYYDDTQTEDSYTAAPAMTEEAVVEEIAAAMPEEIVWISTPAPVFDAATGKYKINVIAKVQGSNSDKFTINYVVTSLDGKEIATSEDGVFTNIPPVTNTKDNPESMYTFTARAMRDGECVQTISYDIPDFKVVKNEDKSVDKMTIAQMQNLIDTHALISGNPQLASTVRAKCQGTMGDDVPPTELKNLIRYCKMNDAKVRVISLEYDEQGRVTCVVYAPQA